MMKMTTKSNEKLTFHEISIGSYLRLAKLFLIFSFGVLFTAFGQPDRGLGFCVLSYILGYSSIFYLLMQFDRKRIRFSLAFLFMFLVQLHQLDWLATTTYHGVKILTVYTGIGVWFAIQFAILGLLLPRKVKLTYIRCGAIAALWTLFEISRLYFLGGFPFNNVGLVMTFHPYMMQMAALTGVFGLSFWVMFSSALGARAILNRSFSSLAIWLFTLLTPPVFGVFHINHHDEKSVLQKHINVALVQTALQVEQKWNFPTHSESYVGVIDQWKSITQMLQNSGKRSFDLIVIPELALPGYAFSPDINFDSALKSVLEKNNRLPSLKQSKARINTKGRWNVSHAWIAQAIANQFKSELVIGLLDRNDFLDQSYNSAFHFIPFRSAIHRYDKRVLVPMAEYMPIPAGSSFLEKYGISTFFSPGSEAKVFLGEIPMAASICYEEGYSNLMRESRLKGAELLVNVTNDGWFPRSRLPQEHFNVGILRAIENGVPVVRSCNTGVTAAIDSLGRVQGELKEFDAAGHPLPGVVTASLGTYTYKTLYSLLGNNLIALVSLLILLFFFSYQRAFDL